VLHRLRIAGCVTPILTRPSIILIHKHTLGVPRRINHLMDRCLLVGKRISASVIDQKLVQSTIEQYPS